MDDHASLLVQLATYRRTVDFELERAAHHGGVAAAPAELKHRLASARAAIAGLKATLRDAGAEVPDLPGDFAAPEASAPAPGAPMQPAPAVQGSVSNSGTTQGAAIGTNSGSVTNNFYGTPAPGAPAADPLGTARALLGRMPAAEADAIPAPAPLPPGSRMPIAPNALFVGREAELRAVAAALRSGGTCVIAAATGMGGIGKSQLAAEFAHRFGQFFAGGVCWMSFAEAGSVAAEVAACGAALGIAGWETLPLAEQAAQVRQRWHAPMPTLLVFDNCEDEALLDQWRPTSGGARVLLTSRRPAWDPTLGVRALPLQTLPRAQSIALLRGFRPELPPEEDAALGALAAELGDLPLALHLAGSVLRRYARALGPAQYTARLRAPGALLAQLRVDGRSPTGHDQDVARTFALSLERLQPTVPADALARALLARAACFAPGEPIPRDLLAATAPAEAADALLVEDALTRLCELGLLEEEQNGALRLHRLIAAFAQSALNDDAAQAAAEDALLAIAEREDINYTQAHAYRPVHMHLRHLAAGCTDRADRRAADLQRRLGEYFRWSYEHDAALASYHAALGLYRAVGDRLGEANLLARQGQLALIGGDTPAATSLLDAALAIYRAIGAHYHEAAQIGNYGWVLRRNGREAEARPYLLRAAELFAAMGMDDFAEEARAAAADVDAPQEDGG